MDINTQKSMFLPISGGINPDIPLIPVENTPLSIDHYFRCAGCDCLRPFGRVRVDRGEAVDYDVFACHHCGHEVRFPQW